MTIGPPAATGTDATEAHCSIAICVTVIWVPEVACTEAYISTAACVIHMAGVPLPHCSAAI